MDDLLADGRIAPTVTRHLIVIHCRIPPTQARPSGAPPDGSAAVLCTPSVKKATIALPATLSRAVLPFDQSLPKPWYNLKVKTGRPTLALKRTADAYLLAVIE